MDDAVEEPGEESDDDQDQHYREDGDDEVDERGHEPYNLREQIGNSSEIDFGHGNTSS